MPIDKNFVPLHIGIIMDGNGRWAKQRNLPRTSGHKEGLNAAKAVVKAASELGIKYITLYTFSTENWKRTETEVGYLMNLIAVHLRAEFEFYKENGIRIKHIGNISNLPEKVRTEINKSVKDTENFKGTTVILAINYGGRDEIVRSVKKIIEKDITQASVSENIISENFDIPEMPDVDLLIRTGGEMRLSNFLLWHSAYAELVFKDTLWPDYSREEFFNDIEVFQKRTRKFGSVCDT